MKKNFVAMGEYYHSNSAGLVRTVCRAIDVASGNPMIAYVNVKTGGIASEIFLMPENDFMTTFMV